MSRRVFQWLTLTVSLLSICFLGDLALTEAVEVGQKAASFTLTDPSSRPFEFQLVVPPSKTLLLFYWNRN